MEQPVEHQCLPRLARHCARCGADIAPPSYCETCGAEREAGHICQPHPLEHICSPPAAGGRCLACAEPLPDRRFCATCGADVTPLHRCAAASLTHVPRPDPVHICPAHRLERCALCGELLPGRVFCQRCGMDVTPQHRCAPAPAPHVCPPTVTMPRRCSHCGELLPRPRHCPQCGADITPRHLCEARA